MSEVPAGAECGLTMVSRHIYIVARTDWADFCAVAREYGFDFPYSKEDDEYHVYTDDDVVEDVLWAIEAEANAKQLEFALATLQVCGRGSELSSADSRC